MKFKHSAELDVYAAGVLVGSLCTVHYIAHRAQAIRLAGATLPQPSPPPPKEDESKHPPAPIGRRISSSLRSLRRNAIPFAPVILISFVLPHIASQMVLDGAALLFFSNVSFTVYRAAWTNVENGVSWKWGTAKTPFLSITPIGPRQWWAAPAFGATITITLAILEYYRLNYLSFALVPPVLIALAINAHGLTIKGLCKLSAIFMGALVGVLGAIAGGVALWQTYHPASTPSHPEPEEPAAAAPSPWIFLMMSPLLTGGSLLLSAMFMNITLRFDASQSDAVRLDEVAADVVIEGDKAIAPIVVRSNPEKPLFSAGMISLTITQLLAYAGTRFAPRGPKSDGIAEYQLGLQTTMLFVPLGIASWAWVNGKLGQWYNYEEKSLYHGEEQLDSEAMDDVENLVSEDKKVLEHL